MPDRPPSEHDPNSAAVEWLKEQLFREKRARELLQGVAAAAAQATAEEDVLKVALDQICLGTGWPVGHVYLRDGKTGLHPAPIWHLQDPARFEGFRGITEATPLSLGVGLPGRVLAEGKPVWIMDVHDDANFPRIHAAADLGVRAGFGFPVLVEKEILAVLEFFSERAVEPDNQLLEVMANIGTTLGRIIQQKRAEEALRESEMRFRSIAHSANDAIITANSDGNIISWNHGAEKIFGYNEQQILGQPLTTIIPHRFREAHLRGLQRVNETGESRVIGKTVELAGVRKSGAEFPLELSLASWKLRGHTFYSGIIRDISERKMAEENLRKFAEELEARVQAGIDALREAERMAAYGNMVACVAHEIRHPVFALRSTAYVLRDKIRDQGNLASQFAILERETDRISRLMEDLLEFAKPATLELSSVAADSLLELAKEEFLARGDGRIQVEVIAPAAGIPAVMMDRDRILQVMVNLMLNAQKHARNATTIRLSAAPAEPPHFEESAPTAVDGCVRFQVQNDGAGIPPDLLPKIFEPFFTTGKGTGLGLAIVRRIILEHAGSVHVESGTPEGTTFSFLLPIAGPQKPPL